MTTGVQLRFIDKVQEDGDGSDNYLFGMVAHCYMREVAVLSLKRVDGRYFAVTPDGYVISKTVRLMNCWRSNMHDWRISVRFRFEGSVWCGTGPADGSKLRCRRTKLKGLYAK